MPSRAFSCKMRQGRNTVVKAAQKNVTVLSKKKAQKEALDSGSIKVAQEDEELLAESYGQIELAHMELGKLRMIFLRQEAQAVQVLTKHEQYTISVLQSVAAKHGIDAAGKNGSWNYDISTAKLTRTEQK